MFIFSFHVFYAISNIFRKKNLVGVCKNIFFLEKQFFHFHVFYAFYAIFYEFLKDWKMPLHLLYVPLFVFAL